MDACEDVSWLRRNGDVGGVIVGRLKGANVVPEGRNLLPGDAEGKVGVGGKKFKPARTAVVVAPEAAATAVAAATAANETGANGAT